MIGQKSVISKIPCEAHLDDATKVDLFDSSDKANTRSQSPYDFGCSKDPHLGAWNDAQR